MIVSRSASERGRAIAGGDLRARVKGSGKKRKEEEVKGGSVCESLD